MDLTKILPLPESASLHGHKIDLLINLLHLLMLVLFVGWAVYFVVALFRFNRRRHPKADHHGTKTHVSSVIEVGVVIAEAALLLGFSIPFWTQHVDILPMQKNTAGRKDIVEVRVIAEQFAWNIHYPGKDGLFGSSDLKYFDKQSNPIGLDPTDPNGKDDITTINHLHLPIGKTALIYLSSKDVMHSFSLPEMRVKQDVIPGMETPTWFVPTKTGKFEIACAQLCGLGHYRMKGYLTVESEADYEKWLDEQAQSAEEEESADDFWF